MKRINLFQVILLFCIFAILNGYASSSQALATINKISVLPEELNTKIVIETSSLLQIPKTYYSLEAPSTIVIELSAVNTAVEPQIVQEKDAVVESVKIEKAGAEQCRLLIGLKEKVPYRISSSGESTVVELNRIQRELPGYVLARETEENLKKIAKREIAFKDVSISEEQDRIHITARLSESPITQIFAVDNPLRLVVDYFDTTLSIEPAVLSPVKSLGIERVRTGQFQFLSPYTIARMVFDLSEPRYYTIAADGNGFVFSFYKDDTAQAPPVISTPAPMPSVAPLPKPQPPAPAPPTPQPEQPKPEVIKKPEVLKEEVPPKEEKPVEAAKPAEAVKPAEEVKPAEAVKPAEEVKPAEVAPPTPPKPSLPAPAKEQPAEDQFKPKTIVETGEKYTGQLMDLKFKDADLRDVVLSIGYQFGLNVVFDPEVRGTVTCDFVGIPWDQALDILLTTNKMGRVIEGNVLRIAPMSVLTKEDEEHRKLRESKELAQPTAVKTFVLSYAKVKDVSTLVSKKISSRGGIIVDERTNTIVVEDVRDRLDLIEKLISLFDAPNPQVSIEARVIEASSNFIKSLGIQWGFRGEADPFYGNQTNLKFPNKILVDGALIPKGVETKGIAGPLGGYAINLPAPAFNTALGLSFANVMDTFRIDMAISTLESTGEGRIISCPTVTTQNYQKAEIIQGRQIPIQTTANFTTTTRYVNAALELRATPQITAEGTIIMDIELRNDAADFAHAVNNIPTITTQTATTRVMVNDGGTTVIGGIYRTEDSVTRERVPLLHKIPILGSLFRNYSRTKTNRELIIFITPRIIK